MIPMPLPLSRDLVLVGGGHSHALVARMWAMAPLPGARLTLINDGPGAAYSGMLPGFIAGHYSREALDIDMVRLARFAGARLVLGRVSGIDAANRQVLIEGQAPVPYDIVSVNVGITSAMPDLPGFAAHGVPVKPLGRFASAWAAFRDGAAHPQVAVIGGGVAGAETAMAMAHALRGRNARVHLIDRSTALAEVGPRARTRLLAALNETGVALVEHATVAQVTSAAVVLDDGREIASDFTLGAAGARPWPWLAEIGVETHDGFIRVGPTLQSSDPTLFAAGDCAHLAFAPRPKAGVYAVREAPVLAQNLRAALSGGKMRRYRPQGDYLKLISLGKKSALAEKLGQAVAGPLLWRWKDRIDQRFMGRFRDLRPMQPALPRARAMGLDDAQAAKMMCAGCGAKVSHGALDAALSRLPQPARDDITPLPGDDAALLKIGGRGQVLSTDHLRAITDDPALMARITAIHALGDIWAMGAQPQAALLSVILPRMTDTLQERSMETILSAIGPVLSEAGAALVGGHSSMGAELTIGLSVTGLADSPITLAGAQAGDALLLTKPIGSGTILAADMALAAPGDVVAACWGWMEQGQGAAARILAPDAHAMTDVTGFGLAGHLHRIARASGLGAVLDLAEIPLMEGAEALAEAGVRSSIFAANRAASGVAIGPETARAALAHDPQTAGGLLAAVPAARAAPLLEALAAAGYRAAQIGQMTEGAGLVLR